MVQIVWTKQAVDDLEAIRLYVEQFNFQAAQHLSERLFRLGMSLADFPERGTPAGQGRRQLSTVWPYLLKYRYDGGVVTILAIRHGARAIEDDDVI